MRPILFSCSGSTADLITLAALRASDADIRCIVQTPGERTRVDFPGKAAELFGGEVPWLQVNVPPLRSFFGPGGGKAAAGEAQSLSRVLSWFAAAADGGAVLVSTARLTLPAIFFLSDPAHAAKLSGVAVLGGSIYGGDSTPTAEANIYADPEAAEIVLARAKNVTLLPLETAKQCCVPAELFPDLLPHAAQTEQTDAAGLGLLLSLEQPQAATCAQYRVRVELESAPSRGCTVCDVLCRDKTQPLHTFVTALDEAAFSALARRASRVWQQGGISDDKA